jgi:diguanylate cyclase
MNAMLNRLRNDFELAIVTLFCLLGIFGIAPFAIYRYLAGNNMAAMMDTIIVIAIVFALIHAWYSGNAKRAGIVFVIVTNMGCIASASMLGLAGLFWTFPVLLVNFLVLGRRMALVVSLFTLSVLGLHGEAFESHLELMMFLVTAFVVCLQALIFAYRTATQRQQLEELSLSDPLTGAQNRRAMNQEVNIAIKLHQRNRQPFGLMMMDLDHFKRINDKYGHEEGDDVLIRFSELVKEYSRKTDRFFRMGGEEFLLLLPDADAVALNTIAEHHCRHIEQHLRCRGEVVTVSIGGASLNAGEDMQRWLARADAALYAAKNTGRNCAVVDDGRSIST